MVSEWRTVRLGDVVEIYDGPHATPKKTDKGPIFLGIANLVNGRLDLRVTEHLSEEDFVRWTRRVLPRQGDIVFSYETRLGEAAMIPAGLRCCLGRRMGLLRPKNSAVDSRHLLYAYLGPEFQEVIRSRTVHGSTVDRIPLAQMPEFPIRLPSIRTQKAIAHILGSLDDKIELNRRMSKTLEDMAQAVFKSWFIDFDPVKAKMDEREPYGLKPEIADLFPSRLVQSELGPIPEGWHVKEIQDLCDSIESGGTPRRMITEYWNGGTIPWFKTGELIDGPLLESEEYITELGLQNSSCKLWNPGTVLMALYASPTVGRLGILRVVGTANQACCALVAKPDVGTYYLFEALRNGRQEFQSIAVGAAQQNINQQVVRQHKVLLPPVKLLRCYSQLVTPLYDAITNDAAQSLTLSRIRDTLLPKLMSGEIQVSDVERFLEVNT